MKKPVISAKEAVDLIKDGTTLFLGGFLSFSLPEEILTELERSYINHRHPRNLNVITVAGLGGDGIGRGINHLAHSGMIGRLYTSNLSLANRIYPFIENNEFPTFMAPQGVISHQLRAISGGKPGVITHVGLKTFSDPRIDGCKINKKAKESPEEVVQLIKINNKESLFYPSFPINVALIKGTTADELGNLSLEKEALILEQFELAAATKNSGGTVIAQVDRIAEKRTIPAKNIVVPGKLIDYIVIGSPENSRQHYAGEAAYMPSWSGEIKIPLASLKPLPLNIKKVIARRACMELKEDSFINLGIGIPTAVSQVLNEEGLSDRVSLSIESGVTGGVPADGRATGASYNPDAILKQPDIFDFYDGGGIDFACLGGAEFDKEGNVNVSKFAGRIPGPGGFINISQNAKVVCFLGPFTAGKSKIAVTDGRLNIIEDAPKVKFVKKVKHITFSGEYSRDIGKQKVFYITERAVFQLKQEGMTLIEIAPGIDIQKDILNKMEFKPIIADNIKKMDSRIFRNQSMELWKGFDKLANNIL